MIFLRIRMRYFGMYLLARPMLGIRLATLPRELLIDLVWGEVMKMYQNALLHKDLVADKNVGKRCWCTSKYIGSPILVAYTS